MNNFLVSRRAQVDYYLATGFLPSRLDALSELTFEPGSLAQTFDRSFRTGQPYESMSMWTTIEHQLSLALDQVATEVMANPAEDVDAVLHQRLDALARRLDLLLDD